jgi:hypothetical protein
VEFFTGRECTLKDQSRLAVKITTIDSNFQASAADLGDCHSSTIAETIFRIQIPHQYHWCANAQLQVGNQQIGNLQAVEKLSRELFLTMGIVIQISLIIGVEGVELAFYLVKKYSIQLLHLGVAGRKDGVANEEIRVLMGAKKLVSWVDRVDKI